MLACIGIENSITPMAKRARSLLCGVLLSIVERSDLEEKGKRLSRVAPILICHGIEKERKKERKEERKRHTLSGAKRVLWIRFLYRHTESKQQQNPSILRIYEKNQRSKTISYGRFQRLKTTIVGLQTLNLSEFLFDFLLSFFSQKSKGFRRNPSKGISCVLRVSTKNHTTQFVLQTL